MPESTARTLKEAALKDPTIIRDVVKGAVTENLGIPENAWEQGDEKTRGHSIKPPYEAWAKASNGVSKMYFAEPGAKTFDPSRIRNFTA
jgi:hypothetical protein